VHRARRRTPQRLYPGARTGARVTAAAQRRARAPSCRRRRLRPLRGCPDVAPGAELRAGVKDCARARFFRASRRLKRDGACHDTRSSLR
jgi:hypothetical protein